MPSFDIVSKIDMPSVLNALDGVRKEINTRYDFKGSICEVEHQDDKIIIKADDELLLGIRPEHIFFKKEHAVRVSKDDNFAEIQVTSELNEYVGHEQIITFNYQGQEILGKFSSSIEVESGKEITLYVDLNNICFQELTR